MPAKGRVNVTIQMLFCLVPFLDMVAAYRVKRLRRYLVIFFLVGGVPVVVAERILFPSPDLSTKGWIEFMTFYYGVNESHFAFSVIVWVGLILFAMYLIRRFSKQWNLQFS